MDKHKCNIEKPLIGIVSTIVEATNGEIKSAISTDYIEAVIKADGIPLQIPYSPVNSGLNLLDLCDGLLLPGGPDIHPLLYNQDSHKGIGKVYPDLDKFQFELFHKALSDDMPILGICRGCQLINIALGGNLYQDMEEISTIQRHYMDADDTVNAHRITTNISLPLRKLLGERFEVNSFHHQAINKLGENLQVAACADDGVTEAIIMDQKKFVWGIQWHPEMLLTASDTMLPIFKAFINATEKKAEYQ